MIGEVTTLPFYFIMKNIKLKILYKLWIYLNSKNKFPKTCERINLYINKLENE